MTQKSYSKFFDSAKKGLVTMVAVLTLFAGSALADDIRLDMEGTTATVPKGNTVQRKIFGIPVGIPGTLKLRLKWHAVNILPAYNVLRVELKHGNNTILSARNCYSIHAPSDRTPKCSFDINVSGTEANINAAWTLVVTNNSNFEVMGFNIEKESGDLNPLVPSFRSVYSPNCPNTVVLDMEGTTATIPKGNTVVRKLFGVGKAAGVLRLKAKWHAVNILPTFNSLKIELLRPDGTPVSSVSGNYFSLHASNSPKYDITYNMSAAEAAQAGNWSLRITNNSNFEVMGFNITKESGDLNPLVPSFNSTYKANCN